MLQSKVATQRSLNRLEKLASGNVKYFSRCKCQVQHLRQNNFLQHCRLKASWLESSFAGKCLGVLLDKLNISQLCPSGKGQQPSVLGCIRKTIPTSRERVIIPLYSTLMRLQLKLCVQFWASVKWIQQPQSSKESMRWLSTQSPCPVRRRQESGFDQKFQKKLSRYLKIPNR